VRPSDDPQAFLAALEANVERQRHQFIQWGERTRARELDMFRAACANRLGPEYLRTLHQMKRELNIDPLPLRPSTQAKARAKQAKRARRRVSLGKLVIASTVAVVLLTMLVLIIAQLATNPLH
jgi:hypothetical protein